ATAVRVGDLYRLRCPFLTLSHYAFAQIAPVALFGFAVSRHARVPATLRCTREGNRPGGPRGSGAGPPEVGRPAHPSDGAELVRGLAVRAYAISRVDRAAAAERDCPRASDRC